MGLTKFLSNYKFPVLLAAATIAARASAIHLNLQANKIVTPEVKRVDYLQKYITRASRDLAHNHDNLNSAIAECTEILSKGDNNKRFLAYNANSQYYLFSTCFGASLLAATIIAGRYTFKGNKDSQLLEEAAGGC